LNDLARALLFRQGGIQGLNKSVTITFPTTVAFRIHNLRLQWCKHGISWAVESAALPSAEGNNRNWDWD